MFRYKSHRTRRRKLALWQEIIIILTIKLALLFSIWKLCFSDPVQDHLTVQSMQQHIILGSTVDSKIIGKKA